VRSFELAESPVAADGAGNFTVEIGGFEGMRVDDETSKDRIGSRGKIDGRSGLGFDVKNKFVCEIAGEDERGAISGQDERRLAGAKDLGSIDSAERGRRRGMNWRQADDEHRFRIAKGWRVIQAQIEFVLFR
jgi:hypothetical protein